MNESMESLRGKLKQDLRFFRGWIRNPAEVGSVKPTGRAVATAMASFIPLDSELPVLELGPGTGVITEALIRRGIARDKIVSVEYSEDFYHFLVGRFPGVNFVLGDGFRVKELLADKPWKKFSGVVGAIPLLNFPKAVRAKLVADCLDLVQPGGPFIQISYGLRAPTPAVPGKISMESSDWIVKNVPPAKVYTYRALPRPCRSS